MQKAQSYKSNFDKQSAENFIFFFTNFVEHKHDLQNNCRTKIQDFGMICQAKTLHLWNMYL